MSALGAKRTSQQPRVDVAVRQQLEPKLAFLGRPKNSDFALHLLCEVGFIRY
jgi:hypothetical protein